MSTSKLSPQLETIRLKYDLAPTDFWELPQRKGTWIIKHAALEKVTAVAGVMFGPPEIIEADTKNGIAVMSVEGWFRTPNSTDKTGAVIWATGEASDKNSKNAYPWAMAEKRAKDRVVLKLTGIEAYSEGEADDFKQSGQQIASEPRTEASEPVPDAVSRKVFTLLQSDLMGAATSAQLEGVWERWLSTVVNWSELMQQNCHDVLDEMRRYLAEHDGDGRKASRDVIEAELRAAVSMEDLNGKRNKFREGFMKLGKDDQLYLSGVIKEMSQAIAKAGGTMPDFNSLSRVAANPKLTPEEEHAVRVAQTL